ncbi:MAG: SoxR reducing system RseC family protein [Rikenellaceae bacterium]
MGSKNFTHSGIILSVESDFVRVGFESRAACGGCHARDKCGMVDSSMREVNVATLKGESYSVGESVEVAISYQMGIMSVVVAYIIPLILLIVALVVTSSLCTNEGVAAVVSLVVVALYYIGVYIFRSKLDKQIKFTIVK